MTSYKQKINEKIPFSIAHALAKPCSVASSKIISYSNKSTLLCHTYRMDVRSYWSRQLFASYSKQLLGLVSACAIENGVSHLSSACKKSVASAYSIHTRPTLDKRTFY